MSIFVRILFLAYLYSKRIYAITVPDSRSVGKVYANKQRWQALCESLSGTWL
jgi:hypothetical protein